MEHVCHCPLLSPREHAEAPHQSPSLLIPYKRPDSLSGHLPRLPYSPPEPPALGAMASVTARLFLDQNLSLSHTHRLPHCSLQYEFGDREDWQGGRSGSSQEKGASQERRDGAADKAWDLRSRRQAGGEEGPSRQLIGGRGRGRSLAGHLQPAEAPLCVNFCTKMRPQIQDGDTGALPGALPGSASRTIC